MVKFFRTIRRRLLDSDSLQKYLVYAIGEIFLVVIGILIALQINNWNEERKTRNYESYLLNEIAYNLVADGNQVQAILIQRQKTQKSINRMQTYLGTQVINKDTFAVDVAQLFTFERYYPIRTAYEVSKSRGLPISNPVLRTQIASYYEYEQYRVQSSIRDIETFFINKFEPAYEENLSYSEYGVKVDFAKYPNIAFNGWVKNVMVVFRQNNYETIKNIQGFRDKNSALLEAVNIELKKFEK